MLLALAGAVAGAAGCSGSRGGLPQDMGTGGAPGSSDPAGTGGAAGGSGGPAGTGGALVGGGDPGGSGGAPQTGEFWIPEGNPCVSTKSKAACDDQLDPRCFNTCGPLKSGIKNCACTGGMWSCPVCAYNPAADYSCFKLPAATLACPEDPSRPDPSGAHLPQSGDACSLPTCQPCGSALATAYRDSSGAPRVGFCVCSALVDGRYSCASITEWPPQQVDRQ